MPVAFEVRPRQRLSPVLTDQFARVGAVAAGEGGEHLLGGVAAEQRHNGGLHQADGAVEGARIVPAFQRMGGGQMPERGAPGFVAVLAAVDAERHPRQTLFERQPGGGVVDRIDVQHQQRVDPALAHGAAQVGQVAVGGGRHRGAVFHAGAGGAEMVVDGVRQSVQCRRLGVAGNHHRFRAGAAQVLGQGVQPGGVDRAVFGLIRHAGHPQARRQGGGQRGHLGGGKRQPVVAAGAGDRGRAFHAIETIQQRVFAVRPAPAHGVACVHQLGGAAAEHIRVQVQDHPGPVKPVAGLPGLAEQLPGALVGGAVGERLVAVPARGRIEAFQPFYQRVLARRRERAGKQAQPAFAGGPVAALRLQLLEEGGVAAGGALVAYRLRAVRVVEAENFRLGDAVGGAQAGGVLRVAFHLHRPALERLHQHAPGIAVQGQGGGVPAGTPGQQVLRAPCVGGDPFLRLGLAAGQAAQGQGRGHQAQQPAPRHPAFPERRQPGKFFFQQPLEVIAVGQLFEAAPVVAAGAAGQFTAQGGHVGAVFAGDY